MDEVKRALSALCSLPLIKTALLMLLPDGTVKRFAQYVFAFIQTAVFADLIAQMLQLISGVIK